MKRDWAAPLPSLDRGDSAPWFRAPELSGSPTYAFDTVAGRYVLLLFFESAVTPAASEALALIADDRARFDDYTACLFGLTTDRADADKSRIAPTYRGIRYFLG